MVEGVTDETHRVFYELLALYGGEQPVEHAAAALPEPPAVPVALMGQMADGYTALRAEHATQTRLAAERETTTTKAVADTGHGVLAGRRAVAHHLAEYQNRITALVNTGKFAVPALLATTETTLAAVARQVTADTEMAQQQAAKIAPPETPQRRARPAVTSRRTRPSTVVHASTPAPSPTVATRERRKMLRNMQWDASTAGRAVVAAYDQIGKPYVWGGGGVGASTGGFDCSGLVQWAINVASDGEVTLPRTTYDQIYAGERVPLSEVRTGDLVFPAASWSERGPEHVMLAVDNGMVIEAPYAGSSVKESPMPAEAIVIRVL